MASHITNTHDQTANGTAEEEVISSGSMFDGMLPTGSEASADKTSSNARPGSGSVSGGVCNSADDVAPVTAALASLCSIPNNTSSPMTNTKTETEGVPDVPADLTPLPGADIASDSTGCEPESPGTHLTRVRAPATSAVVTTAGILPVSHAAIVAAAAAMSERASELSGSGASKVTAAATEAASNSGGEEGGGGGSSAKSSVASGQQGPKKMPMALVNELAKYNKVKAMYVLEDEAGPAHKKTFYIRLEVGDEKFHAHGPSIRKAQHAAAEVCLQRTNLPRPPPRPAHSYNARGGWGSGMGRGRVTAGTGDLRSSFGSGGGAGAHQPTVELNALAARRGEEVIYTAMDPPPPHHPATHGYPPALTGSGPPPAAGFRGMSAWGCAPQLSSGSMAPSVAVAAASMAAAAAAGGAMGAGPPFGLVPGGQGPSMPSQSPLHMYQHAGRFPPWNAGGAFYSGPGGSVGGGGFPRRFTVLLKVGPREFQGEGGTRQAARNNAAAKALRLLRYMPMPALSLERQQEGGDHPYEHQPQATDERLKPQTTDERVKPCGEEDAAGASTGAEASSESERAAEDGGRVKNVSVCSSDSECDEMSPGSGLARRKSDISVVHEVGLKLRQHATFEMIRESGPAHSKVFIFNCKLGAWEVEGEGNSKKRAKLSSARNMLDLLKREFAETNREYIIKMCSEVAAQRLNVNGEPLKKNTQSRKKNRNLIKAQKTDPEYGQQVNPVSRLIQVQQGRKEADPIFEMVSERGVNKRKEFVYRCSVGDHGTEGVGQNKRLAKRQSAENMLDSLGYKRIEKFPVKSVLKNGSGGTTASGEDTGSEDGESASVSVSSTAVSSNGVTSAGTSSALGTASAASDLPLASQQSQQQPSVPPSRSAPIPRDSDFMRGGGSGSVGGGGSGVKSARPSGFFSVSGKRSGPSHGESGGGSSSGGGHSDALGFIGGGGSGGIGPHSSGANGGGSSPKKNVSFSMARGVLYVPDASFPQQQRVGPHHGTHGQQHPGPPNLHNSSMAAATMTAQALSQQTNNNRLASSPTQSDSRLQFLMQHQPQQQQQQQPPPFRFQPAIAVPGAGADSRSQHQSHPQQHQQPHHHQQQQSHQHQHQQHQHQHQHQQPQQQQQQQQSQPQQQQHNLNIGNFQDMMGFHAANSGWLPLGVSSMAGGGAGGGGLGSLASGPGISSTAGASGAAGAMMAMSGAPQGSGPAGQMDPMRGGGGGGGGSAGHYHHVGTAGGSQPLSPGSFAAPGSASSSAAHHLVAAMQAASSHNGAPPQQLFGPQPSAGLAAAAAAGIFGQSSGAQGPRGSPGGPSSHGDFLHRSSGLGAGPAAGSPGGPTAAALDPFSRANMIMSSPQPPPQPQPQPRAHLDYAAVMNAVQPAESVRPEVQLNLICEQMGYKCQFADQPKGTQQGLSKSDYYSLLTVQVSPSQQFVFSGSGASVQEAHDAAAFACLVQEMQCLKAPYSEVMHFNMPSHTGSAPELLGGPPV